MSDAFEPLFKFDSDWHNNACLNFQYDMSHGYVEGYKCAADSLVIQVNEKGRDQDYLVYPIVFLYRHHLELLLKSIVKTGRQLLNEGSDYPMHHRIDQLWPLVKGMVRQAWGKPDPVEFKLVDHVIKELSEADLESMSFRYAKSKRGDKHNPALLYINLRHLGQTIDKISSFLGGIDTEFSSHLEERNSGLL